MNKTNLALIYVALPVFTALVSCTTPAPNPPLPASWRTPRPAVEVMHDAIPLPPRETRELIAKINAKLKRAYSAGDRLSYESFTYSDGYLTLQINEGLHTMYRVELYRFLGRWRVGRTGVACE